MSKTATIKEDEVLEAYRMRSLLTDPQLIRLSKLDLQMRAILAHTHLSDSEKIIRYYDALERYKKIYSDYKRNISSTPTKSSLTTTETQTEGEDVPLPEKATLDDLIRTPAVVEETVKREVSKTPSTATSSFASVSDSSFEDDEETEKNINVMTDKLIAALTKTGNNHHFIKDAVDDTVYITTPDGKTHKISPQNWVRILDHILDRNIRSPLSKTGKASEHGILLSGLIDYFKLLQNPQDYPNFLQLLRLRENPVPSVVTRAAAARLPVQKKRRSTSVDTAVIKKQIGQGKKPSLLGHISFSSWNKNLSL